MLRQASALLCGLWFITGLHAAEFDSAKLAAIQGRMQRFVDEGQIAGGVYVIGTSQGVIAQAAIGAKNVARNEPMPVDALFRIASMTKPITAAGIMILVDEKKLAIDDPVEKYLPEFKRQMVVVERSGDKVTLQPASRPITIKDLCTHTSGMANFGPGLADIYQSRKHTLAEMTLACSQRPLDFEPGAKWAYCNPGIDTLGRIIEVVSGKTYEAFLQERIFTPLGMNDTAPYLDEKNKSRLATLYNLKGGKLVDEGWTLIGPTEGAKHPIPAGGLISSAADIAKFSQAMLLRGELNGQRILSADAVRVMTSNHTGELKAGFTPGVAMGLGWQLVREPQGPTATLSPNAFGHGGAFGTQYWIDPTRDVFMILLIQRSGLANGDASEMRVELQKAAIDALKS